MTNQCAIPVAVKFNILVWVKTSRDILVKRLRLFIKRDGSACPAEIFLNNWYERNANKPTATTVNK